jgi:hypothetical protein
VIRCAEPSGLEVVHAVALQRGRVEVGCALDEEVEQHLGVQHRIGVEGGQLLAARSAPPDVAGEVAELG